MEAWRFKMEAWRFKMEAWRLKMEFWRVWDPGVIDLHHINEEQDLDLDPH
jgi:hypothetical protein